MKIFSTILSFIIICAIGAFITTPSFGEIIPAERRIPWSPGIPGGIPARTIIGANVQDYGAVGDGVTDDTSAIRDAINACPENQVVFFPSGTFRITGTISVTKSVVLRGVGPATKIIFDSNGSTVIRMGTYDQSNSPTNVTGGFNKGSTSITVESTSNLSVGDQIIITQLDDTSLITQGDATWYKRNGRAMGQIVEISAINGNNLTTEPSLYYTYSSAFDPEIERTSDQGNTLKYAGIENMYISRAVNDGMGYIIHMVNASYSWVKNVETNMVSGRHIQLQRVFRSVVRDSYFHHAFNYASGANAYGISVSFYSSDNLIENNITFYLNIPIALENTGGGNVLGYNYSDGARLATALDWQMADMGTHTSHNYMDLIEGNMFTHVNTDNVHGSSSHLTFLRNYTDLDQPYDNPGSNVTGFEIMANNLYMNLVGNVIGTPGVSGVYEHNGTTNCSSNAGFRIGYTGGSCNSWDTRVSATILRHGTFTHMTNITHWDDSISDHVIPWSYYLVSKPSWWDDQGTGRPWPSIGPDIVGYTIDIPAKDRFENQTYDGVVDTIKPGPPLNLQVF